METYGRLGEEGLRFLRKAAGRACTRTSTLAVLGEEGPPAILGAWLERQSVALQKNNAAAFKAAAGAAATWRDLHAPGLEEAALEVLAEAERLAREEQPPSPNSPYRASSPEASPRQHGRGGARHATHHLSHHRVG